MLTRFVRIQLILFTVASVVAMLVMVFGYMQVPTLLGVGRLAVSLELPDTGGLYRFSNVTYRGVQVGKVTAVTMTATGARAELSLARTPRIPADLDIVVRSVSAVGEQYVDLRPRNDSPPYLESGAVLRVDAESLPQPVGPMLDRVSALVASIPKDRLSALLDESFEGFNGAGDDLGSLVDSTSSLSRDLNGASDQMRGLIDDSRPLLDGQAQTADAIRTWARSLAGLTGQLATNDPQVRQVLAKGPDFFDEASRLLDQIKPTLPILLANLSSLGQVGVTYRPALEQVLVLFPPIVSSFVSIAPLNNPTGLPLGDFALTVGDPSPCTVGFLPPSSWRSPADTTTIDTPDGLYCKLPQDSPISVRGARNYPCLDNPGKRAPTVEMCESDKPFLPQAQRQHTLGAYPFDPNLVAQGVPVDDRINPGENLYAPIEGTPLPPEAAPAGATPPAAAPSDEPAPAPAESPPPVEDPAGSPPGVPGGVVPAQPSSFGSADSGRDASVAFAQYDPRSGEYSTADGKRYRQSNLAAAPSSRGWQTMLMG